MGDEAAEATEMHGDREEDTLDVSFVPFASDGSPPRWRAPVPQCLPYLVACLCTICCSGGLILGVGPFGARLVSDGYLDEELVGVVFTGAFQIMTWGSVLVVHIDSRYGPRLCATLGACLELIGTLMLAEIPTNSPYYVMLAYGLIGWGGNHIFITAYQFAQLFPKHVGLADGVLAGLFNAAGLVFMAFNVQSVSIERFFRVWSLVVVAVLCMILTFWPDRGYVVGDQAAISVPTLRYAKSFFDLHIYRSHADQVLNRRYALYAFTFSWSTLISTYINGTLGIYHASSAVGDSYMRWAFPLIGNPSFLFSWIVGYWIDRSGFAGVALFLVACCQISLVCLHARSVGAAWFNLVLLNWISATQYTVQFVFLHKALPIDAFPLGLVVVLVSQGLIGFVANPGLSPNPWGKDYDRPLLILAVPTILLYAWPVVEWRLRKRRRLAEEAEAIPEPLPSPPAFPVHTEILGALDEDAMSRTMSRQTSLAMSRQTSLGTGC